MMTGSIPVISDDEELRRCGVCRVPIPADIDCDKWARTLSKVTPLNMAFEDGEYPYYRNIMEEPDFPFGAVLLHPSSEIGAVVRRYFGITSFDEIRLDDAFCVHYNMDQHDTSGAKHTDPSDITVNLCLEKTADAQGSRVLFHGTQSLNSMEETRSEESFPERFLVDQTPGFATVHWGAHPHETTPLTSSGRRTNIVMTYCYTDETKSDALTRTCYR